MAALGAFDGLHKGHMKVIEAAGANPGIVLFEPVPKQYFGGRGWNSRLTTVAERHELLRDKGINSIITLPFDGLTAGTTPGGFSRLLADIGLFDGFVVGYDFRYGKEARGTTETLAQDLDKLGLSLRVVSPCTENSQPVKSGRIREYLRNGDVRSASNLLGRAYVATGAVSRGRGVGRKLGFPTLNIRVPSSKLIPPAGSYAAFAGIGCRRMKAVAFTVPHRNLIEVHVPGLKDDLYGAEASVEFISFLRKPEKCRTDEQLKTKIGNDLKISMEVLEKWQ